MKKSISLGPFIILLILISSSCSVHKINENPQPKLESIPDKFSVQTKENENNQPNKTWWSIFKDEKLNALIKKGLENNLTIPQALARIKQAMWNRKAISATRLPSLNAGAQINHIDGGFGAQGEFTDLQGSLSWEIDFFNRIGSEVDSLSYLERASYEDFEFIKLSLSAEIASTYFQIVEATSRLELLKRQVSTNQKYLDLLESRFQQGVSAKVDVLQQKGQLLNTQGLIPQTKADLRILHNHLDILLGEIPDGVNRDVSQTFKQIDFHTIVGVPSDLLLNRPDLRSSRDQLISFDAEIALAFADRFPRLTLTGTALQRNGSQYSGFIQSLTGGLLLPIIDWGRRRANVNRAEALYKEKVANFTNQFLMAIEEVENKLYQQGRQAEYLITLETRTKVLQETLDQAQSRYKRGISDYLPVLTAITSLNQVELTLLQEKRKQFDIQIQLYKNIGGKTAIVENVNNEESNTQSIQKEDLHDS